MLADGGEALAPVPSSAGVSQRMARQARTGTRPELEIRRILHRRGRRFRVEFDLARLGIARRRADIAFTRQQLAIFVDGCFWHSCPLHRTRPRANGAWWEEKLARNVERDRDTDVRLRAQNWDVIRIWEHEPAAAAADAVERRLDELQAARHPQGRSEGEEQ